MLDHDRVRADTPGCATGAEPGQVFLDSAGSSLPPRVVLDTVIAHLRRESEIGGYRAANERLDDLADVKTAIGALINAAPASIALSDSASRSWADFFYAIPLAPGDRILISEADYASNAIAALQRARASGATVETIPSDHTGQIDLDALTALVDERVRLVSLLHVPTNGGLVNPVAEATRIARSVGALVLLDACQSTGQLPIDVTAWDVDALSATGRKWLRGPRGTGFLYVRPELATSLEPQRLDLHSAQWSGPDEYRLAPDASRFEFWECDVAARLGLGAAVRYLLELGPENVYAAVAERSAYLRKALPEIPGVTVRDIGIRHSGTVSFTVDGHEPIAVRDRLAERDITVTVSHAGSTLLDMTARGLTSVVRASPHCFVGFAELDRFVAAVADL
ncbi:putative aminotransferase [Nocardia brasiliensis NBRC 14402]|uniref:aminotransferase class V-fold PLP-dependent enzyme n=1 Tax=Nocardia brasiliensis TaxID=37326 RepID=UPI000301ADA5|nr:aminotransferase class V-fold PLP-dependent enzyme [Nocardia brasiliensis]ASF11637.1 aminotransferase class V-fold PLP-dependent enzyme [Nocardia brasiliensis]GAJ82734.1 putative aminotransferase [Nocardia brasiliensis NBRC 14402]SUB09566.1 Cysteine desulfurase [Nocardia brasiliensis]